MQNEKESLFGISKYHHSKFSGALSTQGLLRFTPEPQTESAEHNSKRFSPANLPQHHG